MASGSQRQIKQMVNFITQEAKEKANEIRIKVRDVCKHRQITPLTETMASVLASPPDGARLQPREADVLIWSETVCHCDASATWFSLLAVGLVAPLWSCRSCGFLVLLCRLSCSSVYWTESVRTAEL